jgi:translocator protein
MILTYARRTMTPPSREVGPRPLPPVVSLAAWGLLCFAAAAVGSLTMPDPWFAQLQKPAWNPPGWVFGPVWSLLYALMAVAAWMVWRQPLSLARRRALGLFLFQLALNAAWSPLFFGLHAPGLAFADVAVLWAAVLATTIAFSRIHRSAGSLLLPYVAWVSFAAALNFSIWRLNP